MIRVFKIMGGISIVIALYKLAIEMNELEMVTYSYETYSEYLNKHEKRGLRDDIITGAENIVIRYDIENGNTLVNYITEKTSEIYSLIESGYTLTLSGTLVMIKNY